MSQSTIRNFLTPILFSPLLVYCNDTFITFRKIDDDSMAPTLRQGDIVLIQRAELFPAYFQEKLTVNDLTDENSSKIDQQNDIQRTMRLDEISGKAPVDSLTIWRSPPLAMPGDVVAFRSPKRTDTTQFSRIVALGGQRVRPKSSLHKIERVSNYSVWVENNHETDGFNGPVSKKMLVGKVTKIVWPMSRWADVPQVRPPLGRAWWP